MGRKSRVNRAAIRHHNFVPSSGKRHHRHAAFALNVRNGTPHHPQPSHSDNGLTSEASALAGHLTIAIYDSN
jgi:hypothetical protein